MTNQHQENTNTLVQCTLWNAKGKNLASGSNLNGSRRLTNKRHVGAIAPDLSGGFTIVPPAQNVLARL